MEVDEKRWERSCRQTAETTPSIIAPQIGMEHFYATSPPKSDGAGWRIIVSLTAAARPLPFRSFL